MRPFGRAHERSPIANSPDKSSGSENEASSADASSNISTCGTSRVKTFLFSFLSMANRNRGKNLGPTRTAVTRDSVIRRADLIQSCDLFYERADSDMRGLPFRQ